MTERVARRRPLVSARVAHWGAIVFLGMLPAVTVVLLFASAIADDSVATDFRQFYVAAETILDGESPYVDREEPLAPWGGPFPYPPLPALFAAPLTMVSLDVAGLFVMAVLVLVALATLRVLEVGDWRCYGLVLLWPPVISAIQTGNVTLWFALALAVAWRLRERLASPVGLGVALAVKFFVWPVAVWMAATRRYASALLAAGIGAALVVGSWAVIGFDGLRAYPDLLERLEDAVGEDSYTAYIVGLDLGLSSPAARALWLAIGFGVLAAVVVLGRRGDERAAFMLAVAAALALTPIVWLHYFALLRGGRRAGTSPAGRGLVRSPGNGRHARKRAPDTLRDGLDALGRGDDRRARSPRGATRSPGGDYVRGRAMIVISSSR